MIKRLGEGIVNFKALVELGSSFFSVGQFRCSLLLSTFLTSTLLLETSAAHAFEFSTAHSFFYSKKSSSDQAHVTQTLAKVSAKTRLVEPPVNDEEKNALSFLSSDWRGAETTLSFGLEKLKLVQLNAGIGVDLLTSEHDRVLRLGGRKLFGECLLIFKNPFFNIEGGFGVEGSRYQLSGNETDTSLKGFGYYSVVSVESYLSSEISLLASLLWDHQNLSPTSPWLDKDDRGLGQKSLEIESQKLSFGLRFWL